MKIRRNDLVKIIAGNSLHKGKVAKVVYICRKTRRIKLEGIAIKKKVIDSEEKAKSLQKKEFNKLLMIDISNVMFMSSIHNRPVRIGFQQNDSGHKIRIARGKNIRNRLLG